MTDNRRSERSLILRTGRVLFPEEQGFVACAVLNISDTGACILVPNGVDVPDTFTLAIDHDVSVRSCKLAWRRGSRIGLMFNEAESSKSEQS
jgi:hypothetical protein